MNKVSLYTLGCKLNFSETSAIGNEFLNRGFSIVDFDKSLYSPEDKADIFILNTCTVTENAEKECRQIIRKVLRKNPETFVIVTGCYAQLRPEEISAVDGVDVVLGSSEKFKLFSIINNFQKKDLACIYVSPTKELNDFGPAHSTDADSRTRAYLKIQDGCDYKCSFCTIPLARGLSRSMSPDQVIQSFKELVDQDYKEIILTGVNVGDYGKNYDINLYKLLLKLVEIQGDFRIRISSIEPNLLSDDILNLTKENEKLCKHFHIPLQSGSPKILKLMQRRYKADFYKDLILKVKYKIPDAGIGVDVITGFPGETEEDFLTTYNFLNELPVSYLHVFTYSERPDTKAISLPGSVDIFQRKKRNNMLRILSDKKKQFFNNQMLGKELEVLFEAEETDGKIKGFSSNYIRVIHDYSDNLVNEFCRISVNKVEENLCSGHLTEIKKSVDTKAG